MTEKYEYCITVPRTFVHDCTFGKITDLATSSSSGCWYPSLTNTLYHIKALIGILHLTLTVLVKSAITLLGKP